MSSDTVEYISRLKGKTFIHRTVYICFTCYTSIQWREMLRVTQRPAINLIHEVCGYTSPSFTDLVFCFLQILNLSQYQNKMLPSQQKNVPEGIYQFFFLSCVFLNLVSTYMHGSIFALYIYVLLELWYYLLSLLALNWWYFKAQLKWVYLKNKKLPIWCSH